MIHLNGCGKPDEDHGLPCRDKKDKPRIVLLDGKTVRSYARTSNYGKPLEDLNSLMGWKCRMTALGLMDRPDLQHKVRLFADDKTRLSVVVDEALESGGANRQADRGTAVHALTEYIDRAQPLPDGVPEDQQADLRAYRNTLDEHGIEPLLIEAFCVQDTLKVAGTFDRLVRLDGKTYIADLKTSTSVNYPHSWAIQMALYARSMLYDHETHVRTPIDPEINQARALLIWLPAGAATCSLFWIDIQRGWDAAVGLVPMLKRWRSTKDLLVPL